jgi:hypothetical protein
LDLDLLISLIKLVLDSNVIISTIVFGGKPRKILNLIGL